VYGGFFAPDSEIVNYVKTMIIGADGKKAYHNIEEYIYKTALRILQN